MAIDLEKVREQTDAVRHNGKSSALTLQVFLQGRAAGVELTTSQKEEIKTRFTNEITATRDAAQVVLDELSRE